MNSREIDRLRGPILRSVSRSFYLSLRVLPRPLRDPLSLAYLLARATDTLADTPGAPVDLRSEALRSLAEAIQGDLSSMAAAAGLRDSFAPLQSDEAERTLIEALPTVLDWLGLLDDSDRREVRDVLQKINRGQMLDLERFGASRFDKLKALRHSKGTSIRALATSRDLDEYTYLVAGCVGEFWTRLCFAHVPKFSQRPEPEMLALGAQYGKGLQLVNILRDMGSDLKVGRCYLPEDELRSLGLTPDEILAKPARVEVIVRQWRERAERGLSAGIDYACAIRSRRVRFATVLPALIGARTLSVMRAAGAGAFERTVKIPRAEIRMILLSTALASPAALRAMFEKVQGDSRNGDL